MIITTNIFQVILIAILGILVGFWMGTLVATWKYEGKYRDDEGEKRDQRDKPLETDPVKIGTMKARLDQAISDAGIQGDITCVYYKDGCVRVEVNGKYYSMFDSVTGKFFSGDVGSY